MDKDKLKNTKGVDLFDKCMRLYKIDKMDGKQLQKICEKWLELHGYIYIDTIGWILEEDSDISGIKVDGDSYSVNQEKYNEYCSRQKTETFEKSDLFVETKEKLTKKMDMNYGNN